MFQFEIKCGEACVTADEFADEILCTKKSSLTTSRRPLRRVLVSSFSLKLDTFLKWYVILRHSFRFPVQFFLVVLDQLIVKF
jgi:hypothetical protein